MATLFTRISAFSGAFSAPVTFTALSGGRFVGEFLASTPVLDRPFHLRDTYEGDLASLLAAMTAAVDAHEGAGVCVDCDGFHAGEYQRRDGVTEWVCYPCDAREDEPCHGAYADCDCGKCLGGSSAMDDDAAWLASAGWGTDEDY